MRARHWLLGTALVGCWLVSGALGQQSISWQPNLDIAKRVAGQTNRLVLIHFWSPSCGPCQRMEHEVFSRPDVAAAIEAAYVPVKLNADHFPATARQFMIERLPTDVVITPQGQVVASNMGAQAFDKYIGMLNQIASNARAGAAQGYAQMPTASIPAQVPVQPAYGAPSPAGGLQPDLAGAVPVQPAGPGANPAMPPVYGQGGPAPSSPNAGAGYPGFAPSNNPVAATQQPPALPVPSAPAMANAAQPNPGWTNPAGGPVEQPTTNAGGYPGLPNQMPPSWQVAAGNTDTQTQTPPANAENPAGAAAAPQVHPGNPPLALEGYCPVQLSEKERWVKGNSRWGLIHRGRTYLFAGPEEQSRFFADPDRFAPVLSGADVVLVTEQGQQVEGKREYGVWFGTRVYLFAGEESLRRFATDPYRYAQATTDQKAPVAVEANQGMSAGAGPTPRY